MDAFKPTSRYSLIYVFSLPTVPTHAGLLKVGGTSFDSTLAASELAPGCAELMRAARARIKDETNILGIEPQIHHVELAVRIRPDREERYLEPFFDHEVKDVLRASGFPPVKMPGSTAREWYKTDLATVKRAIAAVKAFRPSLDSSELPRTEKPFVFRQEQLDAIDKTLTCFSHQNRMLWDAKMRFGKTPTAFEVVRRGKFRRVIIVTHRPVVRTSWQEDFAKILGRAERPYIFQDHSNLERYSAKKDSDNDAELRRMDEAGDWFVYFASMQDLRGSQCVGGDLKKNEAVFALKWDLVIVDEAHEGTQTELGQVVIEKLVKRSTKLLSLSGTPFNILAKYADDAIYVWDYVMEQRAKEAWEKDHPGISNPYAALPRMNIFTYALDEALPDYVREDLSGKAFNFREFFRTWTGDVRLDGRPVPVGASVGGFVHREDIVRFLDLLSKESDRTNYPFATARNRDLFKHTFWTVPGVAEAKALSGLLQTHPVFGGGRFGIVNVAGDGDDEDGTRAAEALQAVRAKIASCERTITLSCGRLTTGVTVPEWTAVLMLSGSFNASAAQYMQTIFRVQSPGSLDGRRKENCYVFDFAPDRTLTVLAETTEISRKRAKNDEREKHARRALGDFLNYCPVIAVEGGHARKYKVETLMRQIKRIFVMRAIRNGFDDPVIYSDRINHLNPLDLMKFDDLRAIVGTSEAQEMPRKVKINEQGFDDEEREKGERKPVRPLSEEERQRRAEEALRRAQAKTARDTLRAVSIRLPMLIYGAKGEIDEGISIERFPEVVDDVSWEEFMPKGVTKRHFRDFIPYYDADVILAAGLEIRRFAQRADAMPPLARVKEISMLFTRFKNPDKETVLTPWPVVNRHLSDTLGGWCFFDDGFDKDSPLDVPRFVSQAEVTDAVFGKNDARVLEINSKSGLYPLYVAYSLYAGGTHSCASDADTIPTSDNARWRKVIAENVFVVCKTPMAEAITRRTLAGFTDAPVNARCYENILDTLRNDAAKFVRDVVSPSFWGKDGPDMKYDAVVGNPPYQLKGGSGGTNDAPIFQHFCQGATEVRARFVSMITPAKWFSAGREHLLKDFRQRMLGDGHLQKICVFTDSRTLFPSVEIKGGVCYYLECADWKGLCQYVYCHEGTRSSSEIDLTGREVLIRDPQLAAIVEKVTSKAKADGIGFVNEIISADTPFGIPTNPTESKKHRFEVREKRTAKFDTALLYLSNGKRTIGYVKSSEIRKNGGDVDANKVFIPGAGGSGNDMMILGKPELLQGKSVCSQTFLYSRFDTFEQCENFISYLKTRLFRLLVSSLKITQHAQSMVYRHVPLQDFNEAWDDEKLYAKYGLTDEERKFIESRIKPMN